MLIDHKLMMDILEKAITQAKAEQRPYGQLDLLREEMERRKEHFEAFDAHTLRVLETGQDEPRKGDGNA